MGWKGELRGGGIGEEKEWERKWDLKGEGGGEGGEGKRKREIGEVILLRVVEELMKE
jgi:hypothetical protein